MTKKVKASTKSCPNCGGKLHFDPSICDLSCPNCGSNVKFKKSTEIVKVPIYASETDISIKNENEPQTKQFQCTTCGATIEMKNLEITTTCPYCSSPYVSDVKEKKLTPHSVLPFNLTANEAREKFKVAIKKKFFLPKAFKKNLPNAQIDGVYAPAFLFDANVKAKYTATLNRTETRRTHDGKIIIVTIPTRVSGSVANNFVDLPIETSSKLSGSDLQSILPYDFSGTYKFNEDFIRSFSVEHYDDALTICKKRAYDEMRKELERKIERKYSDPVTSINMSMEVSDLKYSYCLLPIYFFHFPYKNKNYTAFMNGQNGKLGRGLPISKVKVGFVAFLGVLLVLACILLSIIL